MLKHIRKYVRLGFVLLLPAYFAILANSVMNRHIHVLPDGIIITHAHPFAKNPDGEKQANHRHTGKDFIFLQSFCIDFYIIPVYSFDFINFKYRQENNNFLPGFFPKDIFIFNNSQRAPPCMV
ncbi:MAG: hypothetical protein RBS73_09375 [Prolixibacteraceae bacterium]|nr:hypothetical protein [Prolixibacteraceae bacterium]